MVIDARHRDKSGQISGKHGNTLIGILRKSYGQDFAKGCADDEKLSGVLLTLDEPSLTRLIHDHNTGNLNNRSASAKLLTMRVVSYSFRVPEQIIARADLCSAFGLQRLLNGGPGSPRIGASKLRR